MSLNSIDMKLEKEIEKIFDEIDNELETSEDAMSIYECFDFHEEDKGLFLSAITDLINCSVIYKEDNKIIYNEICESFINTIIGGNPALAKIILGKLEEQKIIDNKKMLLLCDLIDMKFKEYKNFKRNF